MEWLGSTADVIGILGAVFALLAWIQSRQVGKKIEQEKQRQNRNITIILRSGRQRIELPVGILRAEFTRAEILGRIGMIPMKGRNLENKNKRFSLGYINEPEFFRRINEIIVSDGDTVLEIPCTEEEFDQFDFG